MCPKPVIRLPAACQKPSHAPSFLFWPYSSTPPQTPPTFPFTYDYYVVTEVLGLGNGGVEGLTYT